MVQESNDLVIKGDVIIGVKGGVIEGVTRHPLEVEFAPEKRVLRSDVQRATKKLNDRYEFCSRTPLGNKRTINAMGKQNQALPPRGVLSDMPATIFSSSDPHGVRGGDVKKRRTL